MTYIKNQTSRDTAQHLVSCLYKEAANKFTTANKIFKHLENVYLDSN